MAEKVLVQGGACEKGKEIIRQLLKENDYKTNKIKYEILCVDSPENVYKMQEFLAFDEFTYLSLIPGAPLDINTNIAKVIIAWDNPSR